ncbi:MAG: FAD-binding oxidoreductase [Parvularculaceae bacterium]|nr:FAD-binding oxidoreductase [Parvularculaceae bacterium]
MMSAHAPSYYAATAAPSLDRAALRGKAEADVCIIGGGFTGVASALTLAERGRSVILLEAERIGWGASGRNGGQVLPGWSGESEFVKQLGEPAKEFLDRTRYAGNEIIERTITRYAIACDYQRGAITVANNKRQLAALFAEQGEAQTRSPADHLTLIHGDDLKRFVATDVYAGGLVDPRAAHCHPLNLVLGEARAAETLGVRIFERSPVVDVAKGDPHTVTAANGEVRARTVILAGNAYHQLAKETLGGYMLPAQTFMMATAPLGEARAAALLPGNLAVADANWVLDYFRRTPDHRLLFGGRCTYSNRVAADITGELRPRMVRIFPELDDVAIDYAWTGTIGIPLNRVPLIGEIAPGFFYAQGYSGHGVNCSHIAAQIIADAMDLKDADKKLFEAARHFRIPAAEAIGNPMLAMGMTWFRIKDTLGV